MVEAKTLAPPQPPLPSPENVRTINTFRKVNTPKMFNNGTKKYYASALVKLALQIMQNNENTITDLGKTRVENDIWIIVKLVRVNQKKEGIWEGKGNGELGGKCRIVVEILKILDAEFVKGMVDSSAIAKLMKEVAAKRGIRLEVGPQDGDAVGNARVLDEIHVRWRTMS